MFIGTDCIGQIFGYSIDYRSPTTIYVCIINLFTVCKLWKHIIESNYEIKKNIINHLDWNISPTNFSFLDPMIYFTLTDKLSFDSGYISKDYQIHNTIFITLHNMKKYNIGFNIVSVYIIKLNPNVYYFLVCGHNIKKLIYPTTQSVNFNHLNDCIFGNYGILYIDRSVIPNYYYYNLLNNNRQKLTCVTHPYDNIYFCKYSNLFIIGKYIIDPEIDTVVWSTPSDCVLIYPGLICNDNIIFDIFTGIKLIQISDNYEISQIYKNLNGYNICVKPVQKKFIFM